MRRNRHPLCLYCQRIFLMACLMLSLSAFGFDMDENYYKPVGEWMKDLLWNKGAAKWLKWDQLKTVRLNGSDMSVFGQFVVVDKPGDPDVDPDFMNTRMGFERGPSEYMNYFGLYRGLMMTMGTSSQRKDDEHSGHRALVSTIQSLLKENVPEIREHLQGDHGRLLDQPLFLTGRQEIQDRLHFSIDQYLAIQQALREGLMEYMGDSAITTYGMSALSGARHLSDADKTKIRAERDTTQRNILLLDICEKHGPTASLVLLSSLAMQPSRHLYVRDVFKNLDDWGVIYLLSQELQVSIDSPRSAKKPKPVPGDPDFQEYCLAQVQLMGYLARKHPSANFGEVGVAADKKQAKGDRQTNESALTDLTQLNLGVREIEKEAVESFDCSSCSGKLKGSRMSYCGHRVCGSCATKIKSQAQPLKGGVASVFKCPTCTQYSWDFFEEEGFPLPGLLRTPSKH